MIIVLSLWSSCRQWKPMTLLNRLKGGEQDDVIYTCTMNSVNPLSSSVFPPSFFRVSLFSSSSFFIFVFFLFLLFITTWKCADSVNVSIWTGDRDKVSWSTKNFPVLATCSFVLWRGAFITSISRSCNQRTCFCYVLCTTAIDYLVNEHLPQYVPFSI